MDPRVDPLEAGDPDRIGPYALLGVLGSGGMGRVYLGKSPSGDKVAVKVVQAGLAGNAEFRSRFRREIEAARHIKSRYTQGLVAADPEASPPWMATGFIDGPSLQQRIRSDGPMTAETVLSLGRGIAEALSDIHRAGYVHRDLKPSNVVIDQNGRPHVIDFGIISRAAADTMLTRTELTDTGVVIGTPDYMSPEQRAGQRADSATDVYAFGALLHFAATGFPPHAARSGDPGDPDVSAVPDPRLAAIITDCLAQDPQQRPTADTLLHRLGGSPAPDTEPPEVTGMTGSTGVSQPRRPRRRIVIAAAAVVLTAAAAGLLSPLLGPDDDTRSPTTACSDLPGNGGMTFVQAADDGECYGLVDRARPEDGAESGFGRDPAARRLQARLFSTNRLNLPVAADDLTVVWLGALTCPAYQADGITCADGREYDSERQELQALQLAQARTDLRGQVHVVIANAGADMRHAPQIADLLLKHRASFGRVVVLGGGDSRTVTKTALRALVGAGIPVIAPSLSADDDGPGEPFIDAPGYLQLNPPNHTWATAVVSFVARHSPPTGRQLLVYHVPDPSDLYTESMARDVQFAARAEPKTAARPARLITSPEQLPSSVCATAGQPGSTPAALFFADRWNTFPALAARLTELCGEPGPALLISSDSVNRFMTNDKARSTVRAPWPLAYFRMGAQCSEVAAQAARAPGGEASRLLVAARNLLGQCDPGNGSAQMGDNVALFWDAVALADRSVPTSGGKDLVDTTFAGTVRELTVRKGRLVWPTGTFPEPVCVLTVDRSGSGDRSVANCARAFTGR